MNFYNKDGGPVLPSRALPAGAGKPVASSASASLSAALEQARAERALISRISAAIGRAAMEVLAGRRAVEGLRGIIAAQSLDALTTRASLVRRARHVRGDNALHTTYRSARIGSVHPCCVRPGVYEVSLVIRESARCRAVALRLEEQSGTWKVTALLIG